ncbi:hypothetical protein [Kitasatospora sp. NRRL B-11411]|uniref:hypothetical protein n=1 Tax=Kitasatospora sp. NRRL B-11411 TaxID=1463822 RepID=UPI00068CD3FA|nr:hypothetical protein [Kitasatospora sp. NRRL B-11411]
MSDAGGKIVDHVRHSDRTVIVNSTPLYHNGGDVSSHIKLEAVDDFGWSFDQMIENFRGAGIMTPLEQLISLCPPPSVVPVPETQTVASDIRIPPGHVTLTHHYGPGVFDDFIVVYAPNWPDKYLDIDFRTEESAAILAGKEIPDVRARIAEYQCGPEELIHWASTHNGDSFFWIPTGAPDQWPTLLVAARQFAQEILIGDSTEILLGLLSGSIRSSILPEDFPSGVPEFESLH